MKKTALLIACLALAATGDTGPITWETAYVVDVHGHSGWLQAAADFDGDGLSDLVVANDETGEFHLLLNQGDGSVSEAMVYTATWELNEKRDYPLAAGDLNGDGRPDIACVGTRVGGLTAVGILINDGAGGFTATWFEGDATRLGSPADADGDGDLDLPVSHAGQGTACVFLNDGTGGFSPGPNVPVEEPVENDIAGRFPPPVLGDFDGDGEAELVTRSSYGLEVRPGTGDGRFGEPVVLLDADPDNALVGDFDGDGDLDVLAALLLGQHTPVGPKSGLHLFRGRGDGTFEDAECQTAANCHIPDSGRFLVAADLDGDDDLDLVTNQGVLGLVVSANSGTGEFGAESELALHDEFPESVDPIPHFAFVGEWDGQPGVDIFTPCWYGSPRIFHRSANEPPVITEIVDRSLLEGGTKTVTIEGSGFHPDAYVLTGFDRLPNLTVEDVRWIDAGEMEVDLLVPVRGLAWPHGGFYDVVVVNPSGAAARAVHGILVHPDRTGPVFLRKGKFRNRVIDERHTEFRLKASGNLSHIDHLFAQAGGEIAFSCGHPDGTHVAGGTFPAGDPQRKIKRNRIEIRSYGGRFRLVLRRKSKNRQFQLSMKWPRELPSDGTVFLMLRIGDETIYAEEIWPEVEKKPGLFKRPKAFNR